MGGSGLNFAGRVSWGNDDTILSGHPNGVRRTLAAEGEQTELVIEIDEGENALSPQMLPGGEWVLFTLRPAGVTDWNQARVVVHSLVTGQRRPLINGATDARYVPTGHLVYARGSTLIGDAFDLERLELRADPVSLVEGVRLSRRGVSQFSVSTSGSLLYVPGEADGLNPETRLVMVGRDGDVEETLAEMPGEVLYPRFSPDGSRVAYVINETVRGQGGSSLWVLDLATRRPQRITFDDDTYYGAWSPDSTMLAFSQGLNPGRVLVTPADGSGQPAPLLDTGGSQFPLSWTRDGNALLLVRNIFGGPVTDKDLYTLPLSEENTPVPFLATPARENGGAFSPNGQWIAYVSDESGQDEIFVRPYPARPRGESLVSRLGGTEVVWGPAGTELFYRTGDQLMVASFDAGQVGVETPLFPNHFAVDDASNGRGGNANYDISPDGKFVFVVSTDALDDARVPQLHFVENWFDELLRLVPVN